MQYFEVENLTKEFLDFKVSPPDSHDPNHFNLFEIKTKKDFENYICNFNSTTIFFYKTILNNKSSLIKITNNYINNDSFSINKEINITLKPLEKIIVEDNIMNNTMNNKKKIKLPKWTNVYPQGTTTGDEEQRFFIALERHPKYISRSVSALAKEAKLSVERVEEILEKYIKKQMIYQTNDDLFAYWERVPELVPDEYISASDADKQNRVTAKI